MSFTQERAEPRREDDNAAARDARLLNECSRLEGLVTAAVMRTLGRPADLLRTSARRVSGNTYRVNVFVGPHAASARIAHSFYLEADGDGNILTSSPPVTKSY